MFSRSILPQLILLFALCAGASPSFAADYPPELVIKAKAHVEVARHAYNLGKFDEAQRAYEAAYRLVPRPSLLFNIGQCHRQAGRHKQAIFFFDGYLREANPAPEQRKMVEGLRAESKKALALEDEERHVRLMAEEAQQKAAAKADVTPKIDAKPAPPPPAPVAPPPAPPAPAVDPTAITGTVPPAPEASEDGLHKKWWFWVIVGVGAAAAGTGAAIALSGKGESELPSGSLGTVDWR